MDSALAPSHVWTAAELHARYGSLPLDRLFIKPPGEPATANDVRTLEASGRGLFELDHGLLIRKPSDPLASAFAERLAAGLRQYVQAVKRGVVLTLGAMLRPHDQRVLAPDLSFYREFHPGDATAGVAFASVAPDLVVEIIRPGNTGEEMELKLHEYLTAGTRLVWFAYPRIEEVHVYENLEQVSIHTTQHTLSGGAVAPGFALPLADLFGNR